MSTIKELLASKEALKGKTVTVQGWIRTIRNSKKFSFVVVSDGSTQENLQLIVDAVLPNYEEIKSLLMGSAVKITGEFSVTDKGQAEVIAKDCFIYSATDDQYPLQKKATSLEHLRDVAHLRIRTQLFGAIMRVRHHLAQATHRFFEEEGFFYLNSPILSGVDAEGAGEMFTVTTKAHSKTPINFSEDYFGKEVYLAVTGQLEGECYAMGLGRVYTFGPTFRSENSNTTRHLSEFWMIEPEMAFADFETLSSLAERYVKYLITYALTNAKLELDFIWNRPETTTPQGHLQVLEQVRDSAFIRLSYTKAIELLKASGKSFEYPVEWGKELQSEHERYLAEVHFKAPVIVTDYPKEFKAFYMKQNDDGKTVKAMDVLVPGIGEIIGGSVREDNFDRLTARMKELSMNEASLDWYLDLRRYGSVPHAGFGLGFERAIMYITGMNNIRDVIPFPRTPRNCEF